ncbi:MAG: hypothetical protein NVSMB39_1830 [Candidatus Saccharimonadales bacterium]
MKYHRQNKISHWQKRHKHNGTGEDIAQLSAQQALTAPISQHQLNNPAKSKDQCMD